MPLTAEQEAQLAELQAERSRPEPRTETGLAGVWHTVLDVVSGARAHLAADAWAALHSVVEKELGTLDEGSADPPADEGASSSGSSGKSKSSAKS